MVNKVDKKHSTVKMNKYELIAFFYAIIIIYVIAVILISAIFKNYWLLFLIILAGISSETEERILKSK